MMQGGKRPTKDQKAFHDWLRRSFPTCQNCFGARATDLHHILGSSAQAHGVNIGQWLCTMLCYECNHDNLRLPPKRAQIQDWLAGPLNVYFTRNDELPMGMTVRELVGISTWTR